MGERAPPDGLSLEHDESQLLPTSGCRARKRQESASIKPEDEGTENAATICKMSGLGHWGSHHNDLASQASMILYEAQALVHTLAKRNDPESFRLMMVGTQPTAHCSVRALRLIRQAKAGGRLEEATAAPRANVGVKRRATLSWPEAAVRTPGLGPRPRRDCETEFSAPRGAIVWHAADGPKPDPTYLTPKEAQAELRRLLEHEAARRTAPRTTVGWPLLPGCYQTLRRCDP